MMETEEVGNEPYRCWVCGRLLEGEEQNRGICGICERVAKQMSRQIRAKRRNEDR